MKFRLLVACSAMAASVAATADGGDSVVVVYNRNFSESKKVAEHPRDFLCTRPHLGRSLRLSKTLPHGIIVVTTRTRAAVQTARA